MAERQANRQVASGRPRRPYTIQDQVALRRLEGFVVSPAGSRLIMQIANAAPGKNRFDTSLWSVNADGTGLRRLTRSGRRNTNPAFAPDGQTVYYLADRRFARRQVMRVSLDGGESVAVTTSPIDIDSFR